MLISRHKRPQTHLGRCGRLGTVLGRLCGCLDTAPPPHPPASLHLASATAAAFRSASSPEAATDDRLPHHAQEHLQAGSQSPFAAILVASFSLGAARTASVIPDLRAKQGQQMRRALRNGVRCRGRWCARHKVRLPTPMANGRWQWRTFHHGGHEQLLKLSVLTGQLQEQELENTHCRRCSRLPQPSLLAEVSLSLNDMELTTSGRGGRAGGLNSTKTPTTNLSPYPPGIE